MGQEPNAATMQLVSFRVWTYRSIRDSGVVPVSRLTALVGREQSGKTTLLHALRGLEPRLVMPYSLPDDWPRGKHPQPSLEQLVCEARFRFLPTEQQRLEQQGMIDRTTRGFVVARSYGGEFTYEAWNGAIDDDRMQRTPALTPAPASLAGYAAAAMPEILFADHDGVLPHAVALADLSGTAVHSERAEENGVPALARLLAAVGFPTEAASTTVEPDIVRRAGERLRERLADHGFPLALQLRLEPDPASDGALLRLSLEEDGQVRALDRRPPHARFLLTLDLRIAAALESRSAPPVLLLDAPGRAFRGGFKRRLRPTLQRYADAGCRVIYTARLPFHIELQHPEQVLVLSPTADAEEPLLRGAQAREGFKVNAALGMQGRSSFLIDEQNLVVEGPTDVDLLLALHALFERSGEPALPAGLNALSAGGSYEVVTVSMFLARQGLGVTALLDSDGAGLASVEQIAKALREEPECRRVETLLLGQAAGLPQEHAVIEDLVAPEIYVAAAREVSSAATRDAIDRLVSRDQEGLNGKPNSALARRIAALDLHFSKADVAERLARSFGEMTSTRELPPAMVAASRRLFSAIRGAVDRQSRPHGVAS